MDDRYLLRARRLKDGEFVHGNLLAFGENEAWIKQDTEDVALGCDSTFQVDPATVGQCTGLRDRNGTLIYEGDVLEDNAGQGTVVRFGQYRSIHDSLEYPCGNVGFYAEIIGDEVSRDTLRNDIVFWVARSRIIGNVCENPELMEEETP